MCVDDVVRLGGRALERVQIFILAEGLKIYFFFGITVASHKYAPPFATLALVQAAGGAYTWDVTFSLAITPSLDRAVLWMLTSFLHCHSTTETLNLTV